MASPDITAGQVMDKVRSLLNDTSAQVFTDAVQLPYLNIALQDLKHSMELSNAPVTNAVSTPAITIPIGITEVAFNVGPALPELPDDLIEIQQLWQSDDASGNNWIPMSRVEYIPHYFEGVQANSWSVWAWQENKIKLLPAVSLMYLKIDYIKDLFLTVTAPAVVLGVVNCDSYLQFRTAALLAEFISENPSRAISLNLQANRALEIMEGIDNKGRQAITTRRLPFRASWKRRGFLG